MKNASLLVYKLKIAIEQFELVETQVKFIQREA